MNMNFEFDLFNVIILIINIALIAIYALNSIKLTKLRKNYSDFMTKLGKGNNINEMLQEYVKSVDEIKKENNEIERYCQKLDTDSKNYLKKIGLVRYNAYKDTGSNLSFALAILNEHNTGIVLNGIYGRDTSNIYAKPIVEGKCEYALSKEEKEALEKEKESLISSIERRKKLLSNEGYVKNAPLKIVNSEREKLKDEENKLKALEEKLK